MGSESTRFFQGLGQREILSEGIFEPIDLHFARFIMQISGSVRDELALAASLLSRSSREGHTCLDLNEPLSSLRSDEERAPAIDMPSPGAWQAALRSTLVVGSPGDYRPLILDDEGRLYLYRSFESERLLGENLLRLNAVVRPLDVTLLRSAMVSLFAHDDDEGDSGQKTAAVIALSRSLCVITGGPGTGKTTLVARILALLLEMEPHLKIVLSAPTGKAARRIEESIRRSLDPLECAPEVKAKIPRVASTIHRLIGIVPWSSRPSQLPAVTGCTNTAADDRRL
jgi:exodeoxyribonuclease V alpha subunit